MRTRWAIAGALLVAACGGRLAGGPAETVEEAGGVALDASTTTVDAASEAATVDGGGDGDADSEAEAPPSCSNTAPYCDSFCIKWTLQGPGPRPPGVTVFLRLADVVGYFDDVARLNDLVIPAHGIDCVGDNPPDAAACDWNPMQPRLDAADVHYSNQWNQFTMVGGDPEVWTYVSDLNEWVFVDSAANPAFYQAVLSYDECSLGGPVDASSD